MSEARPVAVALSGVTGRSYAGNANFHRCLCDLLDSAQSEVADYVIPETRPDEHDQHILRAYGAAVRRGVACRTLISPEHLYLVQSTWDPQFDMRSFLARMSHIRLVDAVHGPFTVVDRQSVLLNIENALEPGEYTTSLVLEDDRLAGHLLETFDQLWEQAAGDQERLIAKWEGSAAGVA